MKIIFKKLNYLCHDDCTVCFWFFFFVIVINTQIDPHIFKGHEYEHNNNCKIAPPPHTHTHPHVQVSYKYTTYLAHPINFFALPILQKLRLYQVWFLFGVTPGVDSY